MWRLEMCVGKIKKTKWGICSYQTKLYKSRAPLLSHGVQVVKEESHAMRTSCQQHMHNTWRFYAESNLLLIFDEKWLIKGWHFYMQFMDGRKSYKLKRRCEGLTSIL